MARRNPATAWAKAFERSFVAMARNTLRANTRAANLGLSTSAERRKPPPGDGDWLAGLAMGAAGARRYRLYRPPDVEVGDSLPLMVMLHGCGQDAKGFALATRMNRIAARERFLVLYPEQDRLANAQGCWNWFDTRSGRAYGEAELIMRAIDQVCLLYRVDRARIAVAGLSAGASMAALLVTRHPGRFKAVMMHSGIPPGTAHSTAVGGERDARPPCGPAAGRYAGHDGRVVAAADGDPRRRRSRGVGQQRAGRGRRCGPTRPVRAPADGAACSAASAIR